MPEPSSRALHPIAQSLREYSRGIAGGLVFSLPMLYTMEVWWTGFVASPLRLLACVGGVFLLLLGYNRYAGLHQDASFAEVAIDSVEEMGLGLLLAAGTLVLLGRITGTTSLQDAIGKTVVEAMTVAIGISVGTSQLGLRASDEGDAPGAAQRSAERETSFLGQMAIACCGAVLFAANVAPTDEVLVIASESSPIALFGQALLALLLSALILNYIEFSGSRRLVRRDGLRAVLSETGVTYAVALAASSAVLWFFGRFDGCALPTGIAQAVVLALPSSLGASAGRLLLQ